MREIYKEILSQPVIPVNSQALFGSSKRDRCLSLLDDYSYSFGTVGKMLNLGTPSDPNYERNKENPKVSDVKILPGFSMDFFACDALKGVYANAIGKDGIGYGANVFEKARAAAIEARTRAEAEPDSPANQAFIELQKAIATAGGTYWLAELTVPMN